MAAAVESAVEPTVEVTVTAAVEVVALWVVVTPGQLAIANSDNFCKRRVNV